MQKSGNFLKNTQIPLKDHHAYVKGIHHGPEIAPGGVAIKIVDVLDLYAAQSNPLAVGAQEDLGLSLEVGSGQCDGAKSARGVQPEAALSVIKVLVQSLGYEKGRHPVRIVTLPGEFFCLGHAGADQDSMGIVFMGLQKSGNVCRVMLSIGV